jgi:hydroxyacylglutathione hydrolase
MLFRRFYDDNLAQASYMLGCETTREAIVVDPNADIAKYTRAAGADRLKIAHVTETHIHADFVSGARALADSAGATLHLSAEGGADWGYHESTLASANRLRDGSTIEVGRLRLRSVHTPGHTPVHLTFLVSDLARGDDAVGALTGDFIFVGDVGRPDLLEKAAGAKGSMEGAARDLYRSLQKFRTLPDYLQIWPGHGAGSACGKSLGSMPQSTLGYEKLFNWALGEMGEREFIAKVLQDQPVPPRYFKTMKTVNRGGEALPVSPQPKMLGLEELEAALRNGAPVIDTRTAQRFAAGHLPASLNIPINKSFLNWSGALIPADSDFYILTDRDTDDGVNDILAELCKIGLTRVRGVFRSDLIGEWKSKHGDLQRVRQVDPHEVASRGVREDVQIVDVRNPDEWSKGHLPGAIHIPLAALPDRAGELDPSKPIVVHCQGGGRAAIATSLLQAYGRTDVATLAGGYERWVAEGLETSKAKSSPAARSNTG